MLEPGRKAPSALEEGAHGNWNSREEVTICEQVSRLKFAVALETFWKVFKVLAIRKGRRGPPRFMESGQTKLYSTALHGETTHHPMELSLMIRCCVLSPK